MLVNLKVQIDCNGEFCGKCRRVERDCEGGPACSIFGRYLKMGVGRVDQCIANEMEERNEW